jgi:hypothetical protein
MRLRSAPLLVLLALVLALLGGCQVFYTVTKFTGLKSARKFALTEEIPADLVLSLEVRDVANPKTNYTLIFSRSGKCSFEVQVVAPERRAHAGQFEITEDQVQSLWKAVRDARFDELETRYPDDGEGPDKGNGVQKYYVFADNTEHRVESVFQLVPALETIRKAALAVTPQEVMNATGAPGRKKAPPKEYVGDSTTHHFHLPTCPRLKDLPPANRVTFPAVQTALDYQFTPCPECDPLHPK